jgi:hypothetical protein
MRWCSAAVVGFIALVLAHVERGTASGAAVACATNSSRLPPNTNIDGGDLQHQPTATASLWYDAGHRCGTLTRSTR